MRIPAMLLHITFRVVFLLAELTCSWLRKMLEFLIRALFRFSRQSFRYGAVRPIQDFLAEFCPSAAAMDTSLPTAALGEPPTKFLYIRKGVLNFIKGRLDYRDQLVVRHRGKASGRNSRF